MDATSAAPAQIEPPECEAAAQFDQLPFDSLYEICGHLQAHDVVTLRSVNRSLRDVVSSDPVSRAVACTRYPHEARSGFLESLARDSDGSAWCRRLHLMMGVQQRWSGSSNYPVHYVSGRVGSGPLFCADFMGVTPPAAHHAQEWHCPLFLTAGADGQCRIVRMEQEGGASSSSSSSSSGGAGGSSSGEAAACDDRGGDTSSSSGSGSRRTWAGIDADAPRLPLDRGDNCVRKPGGWRMRVVGEWEGHDGGMLGCSYDPQAHTAVTGAFSGAAALWRVNYHEASRLSELSVKRLKAILRDRGAPYEDCREKQELLARIKLTNALPPAQKLAHLSGHGGTVVDTKHGAGYAVTCSQDGSVRLWDIRRCLEAPPPAGNASVPTAPCVHNLAVNGVGVDVVRWEPAAGTGAVSGSGAGSRILSGGKDGDVKVHDAETGKCTASVPSPNEAWIWCVTSNAGAEWYPEACMRRALTPTTSSSTGGSGSSSGSSGGGSGSSSGWQRGEVGGGEIVLTGSTDSAFRVIDLRVGAIVAHRYCGGNTGYGTRGGGLRSHFDAPPVSGLAAAWEHNRVVTAGFDGCVRVWDLRLLEPLMVLAPPAAARPGGRGGWGHSGDSPDGRFARITLLPDMVVTGGMDGTLHAFDFNLFRSM